MRVPGRRGVAVVTDLLPGRRVGRGLRKVAVQAAEHALMTAGRLEITFVCGPQNFAAYRRSREPLDRSSTGASQETLSMSGFFSHRRR